jgi:rRNA maturation RNase YbeY
LKIEFRYKAGKKRFIYSKQAQRLIYQLVKNENKRLGEITVIFTDNPGILEINKAFLKHQYYTDVISFNYSIKDVLCGDIFISLEQVTENAAQYKNSSLEELFRVIIHGVLHLVGYSDRLEEEKKIMRLKEDQYLCTAKELINLKSDESLL